MANNYIMINQYIFKIIQSSSRYIKKINLIPLSSYICIYKQYYNSPIIPIYFLCMELITFNIVKGQQNNVSCLVKIVL